MMQCARHERLIFKQQSAGSQHRAASLLQTGRRTYWAPADAIGAAAGAMLNRDAQH